MHIASPYEIRNVNGKVLTTEFTIIKEDKETKYITDSYFIEDKGKELVFQRHRVENK